MQQMLIKMALAILAKLITEKFLAKIFLSIGWYLASLTKNFKLDDKIVESAAESLGITDYK